MSSSTTCPQCGASNPLSAGSVRCGSCQHVYANPAGIQARPNAPLQVGAVDLRKPSGGGMPWLPLLLAGGAIGGMFLLTCAGLLGWLLLRSSAPRPAVVAANPVIVQEALDVPVPKPADPELVPIVRPDMPAFPVQPPVMPPPGAAMQFPTPGQAGLVPIKPPTLSADRVVVNLPAPARDVTVGGGGRWLIFHLPGTRELAVFDVNEAKVVKTMPAGADEVKIAAGMDKLMVVHTGTNTVERWNLFTFQKEATGTFPIKVPVVQATMGSASAGPLFIQGVNWPTLGESVFFNVESMQRMNFNYNPHNFFDVDNDVQCRAAANGRAFASISHAGTQTAVLNDNQIRVYRGLVGDAPNPGFDAQVLYTTRGRYSLDLKRMPGGLEPSWPAQTGPYYVRLLGNRELVFHKAEVNAALTTLRDLEGIQPIPPGNRKLWSLDKRIHFIPSARLLVMIPQTNDRLILRRLTWNER